MGKFLQDLRFGARTLLKNPGFAAVAVVSLALGIGAVSTVYTMVAAVVMNPLPFDEADRLLSIRTHWVSQGEAYGSVSWADFRDWQEQSSSFEHIAVYNDNPMNLSGPEGPERVSCGRVTAGFFPLLRIKPHLGRFFLPEETRVGANAVTVLSHGLWERRYGSRPDIVGQAVSLHGRPFTVIGVAPASFHFLEVGPVDLWISMTHGTWFTDSRGSHWMKCIGRLKDGVTQGQALSEMRTIAARISEQYPEANADKSVDLVTSLEGALGDTQAVMLILFGAVALVLLIACVNVANLLLARATARQREIAIRISLGANRSRLIRQLLTESLLLSMLGGLLGLLVASWGIDFVISLMPPANAQFYVDYFDFGMRPHVFLFTAGLAVVTAAVFGLVPALRASNPNVNEFLKEGGAAGLGKGRIRLLGILVVVEVALALVLLVGAGLMIRSFQQLQRVDPGLDPDSILIASISLPTASYKDNASSLDFYKRLFEKIDVLPGVEDAGAITMLPFTDSNTNNAIHPEGHPPLPTGQYYSSETRVATADYFKTLRIPLLTGRVFDQTDWTSDMPVVIVNEAFVKRYWPDEDPLGQRFKFGSHASPSPWMTIVGVVGDVRRQLNRNPDPMLYRYVVQSARPYMTLVIRTSVAPETVAPSLREAVSSLDPDLPLSRVQTMEGLMEDSVWGEKLNSSMFSIFAVIALVLAAVGVYGVINYSVVQRTHEFGIRMALGAQPGTVRNLVTLQGLILGGIGVGIGLPFAFALAQVLVSILYEIKPTDPLTYAAVATGLVVIVLIAGNIPARKATRVDPMVALRYE